MAYVDLSNKHSRTKCRVMGYMAHQACSGKIREIEWDFSATNMWIQPTPTVIY